MPQPQDITGNLGKLKRGRGLPEGEPPRFTTKTIRADERGMHIDAGSWFSWTLVLTALVLQNSFILYMLIGGGH